MSIKSKYENFRGKKGDPNAQSIVGESNATQMVLDPPLPPLFEGGPPPTVYE